MPVPRFVEINGQRYLWRDLVALRHAQATPRVEQPVSSSCARIITGPASAPPSAIANRASSRS